MHGQSVLEQISIDWPRIWSSKLMVDSDSVEPSLQLFGPDFWISLSESHHWTSNLAECRYYRTFKRPYFHIAWGFSHMVGMLVVLYLLWMLIWLTQSKVNVTIGRWPQPLPGPFIPYQASGLAWGTSPKWLILCWAGHKTLTQSISHGMLRCIHWCKLMYVTGW